MGLSVRERIVANVETALDGGGKPTGLTVHRFRTRPIQKDALPAMVIRFGGEDSERITHDGDEKNVLRLLIETRVKVDATTPPDQGLDPYLNWLTTSLMADETLGGLANRIDKRHGEWDAAELDEIYAGALTEFDITYYTDASDPEVSRA